MFKNHLTLGYLLLVGVPLMVLAGTLRAGGRLTAPPAVAGEWAVEHAASNCTPLGARFTVQQVGTDVSIRLTNAPGTTLRGTLEDGHVNASGHTFQITATVSGKAEQRAWQGQLSGKGPGACPAVEFRATRMR